MSASGSTRAVFRVIVGSRALGRLVGSYLVLITVEYGSWITLLVIANARGGPTAAGAVALAQLLPSVALGPMFAGRLARLGLKRGLTLGYAIQTLALGAEAAMVLADASLAVITLPAIIYSVALGTTRPMHAAFLPSAVRMPEELTTDRRSAPREMTLGAMLDPWPKIRC